jgi:hypothetical protein
MYFFETVPFMFVYSPCYGGTFCLTVDIKTFERCGFAAIKID